MSHVYLNSSPLATVAQVMEDPFEEVRTRATVEDLGKGERVALFP